MSKIVKTAGKKYRLYSEDNRPIGDFKTMREAKARQFAREFVLNNKKK